MGLRPSRAIPKAIKMVLVAPLLTLTTKWQYQEDAKRQVGICYLLCRSKSSSEVLSFWRFTSKDKEALFNVAYFLTDNISS